VTDGEGGGHFEVIFNEVILDEVNYPLFDVELSVAFAEAF